MQNLPESSKQLIFKSLRDILPIDKQTNEEDLVIKQGNQFLMPSRNTQIIEEMERKSRLTNVYYDDDQIRDSNTQNLFGDCRVSVHDIPIIRESEDMDNFQIIMKNNQIWSKQNLQKDPECFSRHKNTQNPQYLWIGCSDSRVPANQIVGLKPGQLFVHRNIANQAPTSDVNALSVIQYAVEVLKVKDVIVCGHYGCGGVKAAFKNQDHGSLQCWLSFIRDLRARYRNEFKKNSQHENQDLLVQLNVKQQVLNIARHASVQKRWRQGKQLRIHGLAYRLENGILQNLKLTLSSIEQLPQEYRIY